MQNLTWECETSRDLRKTQRVTGGPHKVSEKMRNDPIYSQPCESRIPLNPNLSARIQPRPDPTYGIPLFLHLSIRRATYVPKHSTTVTFRPQERLVGSSLTK